VLGSLADAKEPAVRAAAEKLQAGREQAVQEAAQVRRGVADADGFFAGVVEGANRGDYVTKYQTERVIQNSDGTVSRRTEIQEVDESGLPMLGAALLNGWVRSKAPEAARTRAAVAMERARLEAWAELLPRLADLYPRSKERSNLVAPRINGPPEPAFALVNTAGRTLTDVTLALDAVHFTTTPDTTNRQVFFVPRWPANATIYLTTAVVPNVPSPKYGRPLIAIPNHQSRDRSSLDRPADNEPWLAAAGGVIETRMAIWAAEAHQPEQATKLSEQVAQAARFELDKAYRLAQADVMRQVARGSGPQGAGVAPSGREKLRASRFVSKGTSAPPPVRRRRHRAPGSRNLVTYPE